jgi:preprotein translocase subunit SecD
MNQYPAWKYLLIIVLLVVGIFYALPNLYGEDPAVQISAMRGGELSDTIQGLVETRLGDAGLDSKAVEATDKQLLIRFNNSEDQLTATDLFKDALGDEYIVALNLAPSTPGWLQAINALPMYLGLDLRGGVHFLMEVDMDAAVQKALERYSSDLRGVLRKAKVRYISIRAKGDTLLVKFRNAEDRDKGMELIHGEYGELQLKEVGKDDAPVVRITLSGWHCSRISPPCVTASTNWVWLNPSSSSRVTGGWLCSYPVFRIPLRRSGFLAQQRRWNTAPWISKMMWKQRATVEYRLVRAFINTVMAVLTC